MKVLDLLKNIHKKKVKVKDREDFFHEFHPYSENVWENEFSKLNAISEEHKHKKNIKEERNKKKYFKEVEKITKKVEEKVAFNLKFKKIKENPTLILKKLKEIAEGK